VELLNDGELLEVADVEDGDELFQDDKPLVDEVRVLEDVEALLEDDDSGPCSKSMVVQLLLSLHVSLSSPANCAWQSLRHESPFMECVALQP
jgi:hypothetical protein